jgi:hypothetical protein
MGKVYFIKTAVTMLIKIPQEALENSLAASPFIVGEELARQINEYVKKENLGYYPALDFFANNDVVEQDLLDTAQGIAWVVAELIRSELRSRLRATFSHVDIEDEQSMAFTMPTIRINQPNALLDLARHYTPNITKVSLIISTIERKPEIDGLEKLVEHKVLRCLEPHFEQVKVTSVSIVDE